MNVLDDLCMPLGSVSALTLLSKSPTIAPHPIIPVLLKFPNQEPICAHALIDSSTQSSLIGELFIHQYLLSMTFLDNPIPIQTIDGKPLNNGFISQAILATLCIQDHSECKSFGIINMN